MIDYNNAVQIIENTVPSQQAQALVIDINKAVSNCIQINNYDYNKASLEISYVESRKQEMPPQQVSTVLQRKVDDRKEIFDAAKEIRKMVSSAGNDFEIKVSAQKSKIEKDNLVLTNLSTQDQIQELEKISEGLDEKVFDKDHLEIIVYEITGLNQKLRYKKQDATDKFQQSLSVLLGQRLREVNAKLGIR